MLVCPVAGCDYVKPWKWGPKIYKRKEHEDMTTYTPMETPQDRENQRRMLERYCKSLGAGFDFRMTETMDKIDATIYRPDGLPVEKAEATQRGVPWGTYDTVTRNRNKLEPLVYQCPKGLVPIFITEWSDRRMFVCRLSIALLHRCQTWTQQRPGELPDQVYGIPLDKFKEVA
jgi:hypothetical protein